jgi:hypothetical protein
MPNPSASIRKRLTAVRHSLRALDRALADFAVAMRAYKRGAISTRNTVGRRSPRLTAARRVAMKLQGQYMGHMRLLRPAQKAMVRVVKAKSGTKAAIRKAQELAGKKRAA